MITEDYCSYEVAKLLKDKGFNDPFTHMFINKDNVKPEKIYVHVRANKELGPTWHGTFIGVHDIEYTRTDAFIEKACEWLNNFYSEDRHCYLVAEDIKAFKQAMEE